jgi:hypothetical protein
LALSQDRRDDQNNAKTQSVETRRSPGNTMACAHQVMASFAAAITGRN